MLKSDTPAGSFSVQLFVLGKKFGCAPGQDPQDYRYLTEGGVDLRFVDHRPADPWSRGTERYQARPFPTGKKVDVRVDFQNIAEEIKVGERVAAVLNLGPAKARVRQGAFPELTIYGSSRLLLPVVQGALPQ